MTGLAFGLLALIYWAAACSSEGSKLPGFSCRMGIGVLSLNLLAMLPASGCEAYFSISCPAPNISVWRLKWANSEWNPGLLIYRCLLNTLRWLCLPVCLQLV